MRRTRSLTLAALLSVSAVCLIHTRAEPAARVRLNVMSYNIHVGVGMDKKQDLNRIAEVIKAGP